MGIDLPLIEAIKNRLASGHQQANWAEKGRVAK